MLEGWQIAAPMTGVAMGDAKKAVGGTRAWGVKLRQGDGGWWVDAVTPLGDRVATYYREKRDAEARRQSQIDRFTREAA
jgi:hypothetical protein